MKGEAATKLGRKRVFFNLKQFLQHFFFKNKNLTCGLLDWLLLFKKNMRFNYFEDKKEN
jgi:hypothetical protein